MWRLFYSGQLKAEVLEAIVYNRRKNLPIIITGANCNLKDLTLCPLNDIKFQAEF